MAPARTIAAAAAAADPLDAALGRAPRLTRTVGAPGRQEDAMTQPRPKPAAVLALTVALLGAGPAAADSGDAFRVFVESLRPEADRQGVPRATFEAAFAGLTPDPSLAALTARQPEFAKPLGAYLAAQVTPARVAAGRGLLERWGADLAAIERRSGVPGPIVVAVWGLETNYGASTGGKDVIRSMATLGALGYRPDLYRAELLAALAMLRDGDARRTDLRGSWAGAMGLPQFMPSSFRAFAVDGDGDGRRDIWADVPDALASIANFLRGKGWAPDRPWGFQVAVPPGLDLRASRGEARDWAARGVARADGAPMPDAGELTLFFPAGAAGPAFLVTPNYEVLKTYNFSDAYVLSVAHLADRMAGGAPLRGPWPDVPPMGRLDRIALQARLADLGYAVDNREGRVSLALRDTIRTAQARVGLPPDGNPTAALLQALPRALRAAPDRP